MIPSAARGALSGTAGGALLVVAFRRRDRLGSLAGILGAGLLASAIVDLANARRVAPRRPGIRVRQRQYIEASPSRVFAFWSDYENFPRILTDVYQVRDIGFGRSHWEVRGPAGIPVEWDAQLTRFVPGRAIAWQSIPGSQVETVGSVQFRADARGGTIVDVSMRFRPRRGLLGRAVAHLYGPEAQERLRLDLCRVKTLIENGSRLTDSELQRRLNATTDSGEVLTAG